MSDTPAIEPLPPALEEAARSIAHEWMERLEYAKGIPEQAQRWLDAGEHEDFDAVYDLKKTLRFVRFVLERAPRDGTAELVAALEAWLAWAAKNQANLYFSDLPESSFTQIGDLAATSRAALARVKGGELGEGWDEPYAHRDPGNARPARTARKAKGER